jgi:hypothetical protein
MSRYFCIGDFIELIKERYPSITKLIICFNPIKSHEKTKSNQLQLYPNEIVIVDSEMKRELDCSKQIKICGCEPDDTYQIVITLSEWKTEALNTNKNFQFLM